MPANLEKGCSKITICQTVFSIYVLSQIPNKVRYLDISFNLISNIKLKNVSRGLLQGLTQLQVLRLDGNRIEGIEQHSFSTLLNLKVLNLTKNKIQHIDRLKPVLSSPVLEELFIGCNKLHRFNSYDLSKSPLSLRKIDFSYNLLISFQIIENIFPVLYHLDISHCGQDRAMLWNITDKAYLNSVMTLYMSGIHIPLESIATFLQILASLYKIRLSEINQVKVEALLQYVSSPELGILLLKGNNISVLTEHMFKHCFNLIELDLSDNEISNISALVFIGLTQLNVMRLQLNQLIQVKRTFQMLPTLNNTFSAINPCLFKDLNNLEVLKLGSNKLLTIDNAFKNCLPSLKNLQLVYNKLSTLTDGSFKSLSNLKSLSISDNQISEIERHAFTGLINLDQLLLSSNRITKKSIRDPTVFSGMPNLKHLDLFSNVISYMDDNLNNPPFIHLKSLKCLSIHSLTSLEMFYGGSMNLDHLHPDTFNSTPKLWFLDRSKNAFSADNSIPPEVFHPVPGLTKLIISKAQLHSLSFLLNARLSRLSVIQASENMLDVINQTLIKSLSRLRYLDMKRNTFTCDCSNEIFIDWAMKSNYTQVIYLSRYTCSYPPSMRGMRFVNLNTESCIVSIDFICFICTSVLAVFTLLASFIYHFLYWQMVYAYYLFLAFLHDNKKKQMHQQHGFQYDAFISYNAQDEPWVVQELLPNLESEQGWRLCLHYRDFEPGKPIIDNIIDGIYSSHKTICLITHSYLRSTWCSKEIQMANFRLFDEQKDVLILVFLEDIPTQQLSPYHQMRKLVKKMTCLRWPKAGEDIRLFWQKLRQALETKGDPEEENTILDKSDQTK
uniref:TIR domain-containing protein n=1 Tax=Electrophorus electricus TaxID=8005 RepID=A0AAY5ECK6_ELEEL